MRGYPASCGRNEKWSFPLFPSLFSLLFMHHSFWLSLSFSSWSPVGSSHLLFWPSVESGGCSFLHPIICPSVHSCRRLKLLNVFDWEMTSTALRQKVPEPLESATSPAGPFLLGEKCIRTKFRPCLLKWKPSFSKDSLFPVKVPAMEKQLLVKEAFVLALWMASLIIPSGLVLLYSYPQHAQKKRERLCELWAFRGDGNTNPFEPVRVVSY